MSIKTTVYKNLRELQLDIYLRGQSHSTRTTGDGIVSRVKKKYNKDLSIVHTFDKPQQFIEAIDSTTSNHSFFLISKLREKN